MIVPLFALANAGIVLNADFLAHAYTDADHPGHPDRLRGRQADRGDRDVARCHLAQQGTDPSAGRLGGRGRQRHDRRHRVHRRAAHRDARVPRRRTGRGQARRAVGRGRWRPCSPGSCTGSPRCCRPRAGPARCSVTPRHVQDLVPEVDPERDHIRGPADATITVIEFGDFECPYCGRAEPVVRELLADTDLRYVWRHLPLTDVHPAGPARGRSGRGRRRAGQVLGDARSVARATRTSCGCVICSRYAEELGLDVDRFHDELHAHTPRDPRRAGRRIRRRQRRLRHADVLRQRTAALRRVRPRDVDGGRADGPCPSEGTVAAGSLARLEFRCLARVPLFGWSSSVFLPSSKQASTGSKNLWLGRAVVTLITASRWVGWRFQLGRVPAVWSR